MPESVQGRAHVSEALEQQLHVLQRKPQPLDAAPGGSRGAVSLAIMASGSPASSTNICILSAACKE